MGTEKLNLAVLVQPLKEAITRAEQSLILEAARNNQLAVWKQRLT